MVGFGLGLQGFGGNFGSHDERIGLDPCCDVVTIVPVPTDPAITGFTGPETGFVASDCGGGGIAIDVEATLQLLDKSGAGPWSVRVTSIDGHYVAGVDYDAIDETIVFEADPEDPENPIWHSTITVHTYAGTGCPFPTDSSNPAFTLTLSEPVNVEIGGTFEFTVLYPETLGIALGI